MNELTRVSELGEGFFGTVYEVKNGENKLFALKIFSKESGHQNYHQECEKATKLKSLIDNNIVKLEDFSYF